MSLHLFWGVGIAGVGMKLIVETDWHAERVRHKAVRLLRYAPVDRPVRRKRLLGRKKVLTVMPFNVIEGVAIIFRVRWLRSIVVCISMIPVVVTWSLGLGCFYLIGRFGIFVQDIGKRIADEEDDEAEIDQGDASGERDRLLSQTRSSDESQD